MQTKNQTGKNFVKGFQGIDQTNSSDYYFRFLDLADQVETIQAYKREMIALLNAKEGQHILDLGCGIGHETQRIAQIVGSNGRVAGIDKSEAVLEEGKRRGNGLNLPIEYYLGDATQIEFADNTFDGCRAERLLTYIENARKALAEMVRVVRPGGTIVIFEFDFDGMIVDFPDHALTRRIVHFVADGFANGMVGAKLPAMFLDSGLSDITVLPQMTSYSYDEYRFFFGAAIDRMTEAGAISESELQEWWNHLEKADKAGQTFAAYLPGFVVSGRKS